MKYFISSSKGACIGMNQKINNDLKNRIKNYNADKWSDMYKHPTQELYAITIKDTDRRNPTTSLTNNEKNSLVESLTPDWYIRNSVIDMDVLTKVE